MKIIKEDLVYIKKSKDFTIEIEEGLLLRLHKWSEDDYASGYDGDWELNEASQQVFDRLEEGKQEKVRDFIETIKL